MPLEFKRLSDRILHALQLALEQRDLQVAEELSKALDDSLTRMSGGKGFTERREAGAVYDAAMKKLGELRRSY
ncbi:MAG: hypothetical protein H6865_05135 [Rhodospirillales bacterium]|nr:hypothetical protein [Alphaproteobacteria bacterium]MCB9987002.1 hypothetical protein [Rhodospirillales bacterium]USO08225.1 MAG: hypothetical protein H6866_03155 [Rhodospirillales bacterium]